MDNRGFVTVGAVASAAVLLSCVLTPLLSPEGAYVYLDGNPGQIDHSWSVSQFAYLLGDFLCHQQMDRSFILNGSQMPFCIRDTGLLIGLTVGMAVCIFLNHRLSDRRYGIAGVLLMAVTGIEWIAQNFVASSDGIRFATGIVSGFGTALLLCWILYRNERDGQNVV